MGIPEVSGEFVARMEDVLDLYHQDYDPDIPCLFRRASKLGRQETVHRGQAGSSGTI